MSISKPRKLVNTTNPGGRFMSNTMFDARELLVPGGAYDRGANTYRDPVVQTHDQLGFIGPERAYTRSAMNLPVPVNMFLPQSMPQFQNSQGNSQGHNQKPGRGWRDNRRQKGARSGGVPGMASSQSQSQASQEFSQSQGPLTQGMSMSQHFQMSQGGLSQPGLSGLSQADLSQDSFMQDDFRSQMDVLLSQDSTYQGDRFYLTSQLSQGPFN